MPLTAKGEKILAALVEEYGEKKGKQIFYAGINSGRFTGVDALQLSEKEREILVSMIKEYGPEWLKREYTDFNSNHDPRGKFSSGGGRSKISPSAVSPSSSEEMPTKADIKESGITSALKWLGKRGLQLTAAWTVLGLVSAAVRYLSADSDFDEDEGLEFGTIASEMKRLGIKPASTEEMKNTLEELFPGITTKDYPDPALDTHVKDSTMLQFNETCMLDSVNVRHTSDGYLVAQPRVARTGIQLYSCKECGKPEMDRMVKVYRPESEVFSQDTIKSFAHRPVTLDHPPEMVTADNWKKYSKGHTVDPIVRDGEFVRVPVMLMDRETIKTFEGGKNQLSMGYTCDLKWEPGVTDDGEEYDAVQTNLRMNHLAVVSNARGGDQLRIGDEEEDDIEHYFECPECGEEVPEHEDVCPKCGYNISSFERDSAFEDKGYNDPVTGRWTHAPGGSGGQKRGAAKNPRTQKGVEQKVKEHGYKIYGGSNQQKTLWHGSTKVGVFATKEEAINAANEQIKANIPGLPSDITRLEHEGMSGMLPETRGKVGGVTGPDFKPGRSIFQNRGEAKRHIRQQRKRWRWARVVKHGSSYVPIRGPVGWVAGTGVPGLRHKVKGKYYTVHHDSEPWEIVFDLNSLELTDADLTEVEDFNPNHDPQTGEFTSGSTRLPKPVEHIRHLASQSANEATSQSFASAREAFEHAEKQAETWKKHHANFEEALLEIKRQQRKWESAKILGVKIPGTDPVPGRLETVHGPRRLLGVRQGPIRHYRLHVDNFEDEVELTENDVLEARAWAEMNELSAPEMDLDNQTT